jgi:hypothetical protein
MELKTETSATLKTCKDNVNLCKRFLNLVKRYPEMNPNLFGMAVDELQFWQSLVKDYEIKVKRMKE